MWICGYICLYGKHRQRLTCPINITRYFVISRAKAVFLILDEIVFDTLFHFISVLFYIFHNNFFSSLSSISIAGTICLRRKWLYFLRKTFRKLSDFEFFSFAGRLELFFYHLMLSIVACSFCAISGFKHFDHRTQIAIVN